MAFKFAPLAAALVLLALLPGQVAAQTDTPFRLIVTHLEPPLVPNSVMDLAVELGYFEREGVQVEIVRVQQTPSALAALQAGEGDMANVGVDALLQAIAAGATDFRAVTSPNVSLPFLFAARQDITSVDALSGASFGVGRIGSLDHSLSALVLTSLGHDLDASEIVTLGQPNVRAQALAAGQIDATTMSIGTWASLHVVWRLISIAGITFVFCGKQKSAHRSRVRRRNVPLITAIRPVTAKSIPMV